MRSRLRRGFAAVAAMALAVTLLALTMTAPVISTTADFSIFNSGWNGTSGLAIHTYHAGKFSPTFEVESTGTEITIAQVSLSRISFEPAADALVIIGPTIAFTSSEGAIVGDFVRNGGMLLLADDFGTGNTLLAGMGSTSRFSGELVMDLAFEKQPEFSVCFDIRPDPLTSNVSTLLLNYPSSLVLNDPASSIIARSSIASWLDTSGDRLHEPGEPQGPFPILAREEMGQGTIVLLSDPSILINGMSANLDNLVFSTNLMDYISSHRSSVYFDESHRDFFDPVAVAFKFTGDLSLNAKATLVVIAFILVLWISTDLVDKTVEWMSRKLRSGFYTILGALVPRRWSRKEAVRVEQRTQEELVQMIAEKHPDWRNGLVRYLLRERERHRKMLEQKEL